MHCIGVDVSKQELVVYDGATERVFPNDRGLAQFRRFLGRRPEAFIVFEPTSTYSRRLETLCRTLMIPCCQLNPRIVPHLRHVGKGRSKTDASDAQLLFRYGVERGRLEASQLNNDPLAQTILARLACYRVTQKSRVAAQGLYEALSHDPATPQSVLDELQATIASLKKEEVRHIVQAQDAVYEDEEAARQMECLLSIPGIGPVTALTLQALFRKYPGTNRKQVVALVGFDPIQYQSGTSVHRKSRISKCGHREIRKRLFEATLSAARFNPAISSFYRGLKEQGKPEKVARVAAARKLLVIAHSIYESGQLFNHQDPKEA